MKKTFCSKSLLTFFSTTVVIAGITVAGTALAGTFSFTTTADWATGTATNTNTNPPPAGGDGHVRLNDQIITPFNNIWVALSGRDAIVRIDTNVNPLLIGNNDTTLTTDEAGGTAVKGEYLTRPNGMGGNPSRTTVDKNGDVWVGNRNEGSGGLGSITKVSAAPTGNTSSGVWNGTTFNRLEWTNTAGADTTGGISTAADKAITQYVRTEGANVRHVSVDANNNVWAGGGPLDSGDQVFRLYDANGVAVADPDGAGPKVTSFGDNNTGGYGGLVDGNGVVWSAGLNGNTLTRMDPATGARITVNQGGRQSYGMGIDNTGTIWNATWTNNTLDKISSDGLTVTSYNLAAAGNGLRGVAVTADNDIWVASSYTNEVLRFNPLTGLVTNQINVGALPTGVAVDSNGKVWVTNYDGNSVMRIDPSTNTVDLTVQLGVGANPYNYSDMTGTVLIGTTSPSGTWRKVIDGGVAGTDWDKIFWNEQAEGAIPEFTGLTMEARVSEDQVNWSNYFVFTSGAELNFIGQYLEVRATLTRDGGTTGTPVLSDLRVTTEGGAPVPEPATMLLFGTGLAGLACASRKRRNG